MMASSSLPMPTPTVPNKSFTTFKSLSFDIYGTLIDWDTSVLRLLEPLLSSLSADSPYANPSSNPAARTAVLGRFAHHSYALQITQPDMRYDKVLHEVYLRIASDVNPSTASSSEVQEQAIKFGNAVGEWIAFPDTVDAMKRLGKYYKLVPLSNVDRASFKRTCEGPLKGVPFWRAYVAEDIGSYKPSLKNFEYLLKHLDEDDRAEGGDGISKDQDLMVAQSLFHDHAPSKRMGLASVWIDRRGWAAGNGERSTVANGESVKAFHEKVGYGWRFRTLGEFADEVEKQWEAEAKGR